MSRPTTGQAAGSKLLSRLRGRRAVRGSGAARRVVRGSGGARQSPPARNSCVSTTAGTLCRMLRLGAGARDARHAGGPWPVREWRGAWRRGPSGGASGGPRDGACQRRGGAIRGHRSPGGRYAGNGPAAADSVLPVQTAQKVGQEPRVAQARVAQPRVAWPRVAWPRVAQAVAQAVAWRVSRSPAPGPRRPPIAAGRPEAAAGQGPAGTASVATGRQFGASTGLAGAAETATSAVGTQFLRSAFRVDAADHKM